MQDAGDRERHSTNCLVPASCIQHPASSNNGLACSKGATDFCKVGALGSIPIRSTEMNGLMVQRDDASSAGWRSGFNSRWVH
jgi:hypothetical protein